MFLVWRRYRTKLTGLKYNFPPSMLEYAIMTALQATLITAISPMRSPDGSNNLSSIPTEFDEDKTDLNPSPLPPKPLNQETITDTLITVSTVPCSEHTLGKYPTTLGTACQLIANPEHPPSSLKSLIIYVSSTLPSPAPESTLTQSRFLLNAQLGASSSPFSLTTSQTPISTSHKSTAQQAPGKTSGSEFRLQKPSLSDRSQVHSGTSSPSPSLTTLHVYTLPSQTGAPILYGPFHPMLGTHRLPSGISSTVAGTSTVTKTGRRSKMTLIYSTQT